MEESQKNPNQNSNQNFETEKQEVNQRIAELNAKITFNEAEIANLRQINLLARN